jgi:hypothetical protein
MTVLIDGFAAVLVFATVGRQISMVPLTNRPLAAVSHRGR